MSDHIVSVKPHIAARAQVSSLAQYHQMYEESIADPATFWDRQAKRLTFFQPYRKSCSMTSTRLSFSGSSAAS